jgi:hypothetical protein
MTEAQLKDQATEELMKEGKEVTLKSLNDRVTELKKKAEEEAKRVPPAARTGGVFDGPNTGYNVRLHGNEAVVPLGTGGISRSALGDVLSNLPQPSEVAGRIQPAADNPQGAIADITKAVSDLGQKLLQAGSPIARQASQTASDAANALGIGSNEKLIAELQTLNNVSKQTLGYIKRAVEFDERQLDATLRLNGNLFQ